MRTADEWFQLYGASHKNPTNKLIHWICIPVILWATLALVQSIPHPFPAAPLAHWGTIVYALCLVFYARLSPALFAGMAVVGAGALVLNELVLLTGISLAWTAATAFFVAWIFQFIGHKIEGKKPSFFQDIQFLLVGPAWLLQAVYERVGSSDPTPATSEP